MTEAEQAIEPIRLSLEVACGIDHAFRTWAERTSTWWPAAATMPALRSAPG